MHAEFSNGIARRGDDASRWRTADGNRLSRQARIVYHSRRGEHGIDVTKQNLARPSHSGCPGRLTACQKVKESCSGCKCERGTEVRSGWSLVTDASSCSVPRQL